MNIALTTDQSLENEQVLWRYMSLAKFISMIAQNALWLARADTFKDKHEGRFPDDMKKNIMKVYQQLGNKGSSPIQNAQDLQDYLVKNTFINCWHKNCAENMVMWAIYGESNTSIAIQTSIGKIKTAINTSDLNGHCLNLKNVTYLESDAIPETLRYEHCFFIKRPHFSFEQEVRISLDTYYPNNPSKETPYGHMLPVNISNLINKILIHPDSPDWFEEVIASITDKYKIHAPVSRGSCTTN
jgi:hypothetical protein